jgi:hypothetical protein
MVALGIESHTIEPRSELSNNCGIGETRKGGIASPFLTLNFFNP